VGGGRDNVVSGNACVGAVDTCVHVDARGLTWQAAACTANATYTGDLVQGLFNVNYTQPPYAVAFPEIVDTLSRRPCTPVNLTVAGNTYCSASTKQFIDVPAASTTAWGDTVAGNVGVQC
jgi:hypothetical protein